MALFALTGCGHVELHELVVSAPGAGASTSSHLEGPEGPAVRPAREIALLEAVGSGSEATRSSVLAALTARAAALRCDALVRVRVDQGHTRSHAFGVCVRWLATDLAAQAGTGRTADRIAGR
jgi:hypothetical protein